MNRLTKRLVRPFGVLAQGRWRFGLRQAAIVIVATIIAMGVRNLLTPWVGTGLPFVTAFPAVAIVAFFSGITTGAMTAARVRAVAVRAVGATGSRCRLGLGRGRRVPSGGLPGRVF